MSALPGEATIRRAGQGDVRLLAELRGAFWQSQVQSGLPERRAMGPEHLFAETEAMVVRPRTSVLLALASDGEALGYALASLQIVPGQEPSRVTVVEDLFVCPGGARRGLGRQLAEQALAEVAGGGEAVQQVRVVAGNAVGRAFWQGLGFRDLLVTMDRHADG